MKQQFLKAISDTIRITIYSDNRPIVPASANVTLYKPSGASLQTQTAASVDGATGEMTYTITTTHTATASLNYKAVWDYVVSGVTYYQTQLFDVVLSNLAIPITDEDLYNELDSLRKANYQLTGTATAGAAGTLTDTGRKEDNDFWKGGVIKILAGTGVGQQRNVTGFTQSTGVLTIAPDFVTNPSTDSVYILVRSFSTKIQAAFDSLCTMIYNKGKRHSLILESSQIAQPMIYLSIHLVALDLMDEEGDKWSRLAAIYQEKFDKSFNNMTLDYDKDESGSIDESEAQQSQTSLRIGRA